MEHNITSGKKIAHLLIFDSAGFVNNELFDIQDYIKRSVRWEEWPAMKV